MQKSSNIFDSQTQDTNIFSDSNLSSTIFNSNSTQNTTLGSTSFNKNRVAENTHKKKTGITNRPPPFKMQNKNTMNFNNPSALFESTSNDTTGKSSGLFD
jgi:hypothetical protein